MSNTKPGTGPTTPLKEEADEARTQRPEGQPESGGPSPGHGAAPGQPSGQQPPVDDRPQREDEYLSKFLQTPTPENERKDGKEAEPVNKSPDAKPGKAGQ